MTTSGTQCIKVVDSHTGGEPTRVVVSGGPDLGRGDLLTRAKVFRERFDEFRSAVTCEPRGSDALVGALVCEPVDPRCAAGVIFFNNVGYLNMCGHGTIGLVVTLAHLGRIAPGTHLIETVVGTVSAQLHEGDGHQSGSEVAVGNKVTIGNVPSFRSAANIKIYVEGHGDVTGDVAWGGNWFFLTSDHRQELTLGNIERLTDFTRRIRRALARAGVTGSDGVEIDHIELFGPPHSPQADSKNFVLCPGGAYDRSPCGTGTSAKLACLVADGKLKEGQIWRQESIVGSIFEGFAKLAGDKIIPHIKSSAFITAEATLILDPHDPFRGGIRG